MSQYLHGKKVELIYQAFGPGKRNFSMLLLWEYQGRYFEHPKRTKHGIDIFPNPQSFFGYPQGRHNISC